MTKLLLILLIGLVFEAIGVVLLKKGITQVGEVKQVCVTEIVRVPAAHAFPAVLPHAHCFDASAPDATRRFANDYLTLVERVPVFKVSYAPDLARLPELAERILAAVDAARPLTSVLVS